MFNEAFWFFYLVDLVGGLTALAIVIAGFAGIVTFVMLLISALEESWDIWNQWRFTLIISFISAILFAILIPSETTLYVGAGQYVVEATEIDDTLLLLKEAIDQRIEELVETE